MTPGLGILRSVHPPIRVCLSKGYTCTSEKLVLFLTQFIDYHNEYTAIKSSSDKGSDGNNDRSANSNGDSNSGSTDGEDHRIDVHIKG